jgi:DNA-3-methyladenine glycosylase II
MFQQSADELSRNDRALAKLIARIGTITLAPEKTRSPFKALVHAVAHQQLHGKAAATILKRFVALYPGKRFPSPEDLFATPEEQLRAAGFSRAKTAAIRDIAAKTIAGVVPTSRAMARLADAEIVERLTSIRGVGTWTVEMLLIFKLGRPDVWPVTDFGVRKGFAVAFGNGKMPTPKELFAHGERWRPHRTTVAWYLWRAADGAKL